MEADWPRTRTRVSSPVRLLRQRLSRLAIGGERSGQDMMVDQPRYKTSDEVDLVIGGSGAAGGILAKELSSQGFRVVVLEQGPYLTEADFTHNEIEILALDKLTNHPKQQPTTVRKTPDEKAKPQRALVYGRCVGGTSVHFTANFWRFHEIDFIERSKVRSEEHTSELQSQSNLVCRLLLEEKKLNLRFGRRALRLDFQLRQQLVERLLELTLGAVASEVGDGLSAVDRINGRDRLDAELAGE